jgi:hypothetical protein
MLPTPQLRATIRKLIDNAPKALTSGAASGDSQATATAPEAPISSDKPRGVVTPGAASNEAGNGEVSSYSSIADWLENEILGR